VLRAVSVGISVFITERGEGRRPSGCGDLDDRIAAASVILLVLKVVEVASQADGEDSDVATSFHCFIDETSIDDLFILG